MSSSDDEFGAITRYIDIDNGLTELELLVPTLGSLLLEYQFLLTEWMEKYYNKDVDCRDMIRSLKEHKTVINDFAHTHIKVERQSKYVTYPGTIESIV
jgi:hypothetical protein